MKAFEHYLEIEENSAYQTSLLELAELLPYIRGKQI